MMSGQEASEPHRANHRGQSFIRRSPINEPVILEAVRLPFARSGGAFRKEHPDALLAHPLRSLAEQAGLAPEEIGDVVHSTATQADEQGRTSGASA
jgi:acetyl-CoA acetyltransferase